MRNLKPTLLVEDDNVDAMTVERAFKELKIANKLIRAINGEEALKYLRDENNEKPGVILLDLNMPKMNGIEFLKIAKEDKALRRLPVIVLTTSKDEQDVAESFRHSIAGYMVKPVNYEDFLKTVETINQYWTISKLPETV
ncbi:MAG: response regulator [Planctomycetes bacterium]|nr:response regulator [Planctomycetota bacterium]